MSSSYRLEMDKWLSGLNVKADSVLDLGGSQLPIKGRVESWEVNKYVISDLPSPHKDSPKPELEFDLNTDDWSPEMGQFDVVFCLEVFDYIYDPMRAFKSIAEFTKSGGTAWVTFPSFYPLHQPVEDDALRYMPGGIEKLAKAVGLEIMQMIRRRPETDVLDRFFRAERLRAAKHEDHEFLGWIVGFKK